jgi:signal transduction histidine kinase
MHQSAERLKDLIEKFLCYAQIELTARYLDSHDSTFLVPQLTAETIRTAANRVAGEQLRSGDLQVSLEPVQHPISAAHLERIVRELVQNAFKFSSPNTRVEVISSRVDRQFQLEVIDQGRGFSPEQLQRVGANIQFDRRLQEQQGSGLGLAIARRLSELYGGSLQLQSSLGRGTQARVLLPL